MVPAIYGIYLAIAVSEPTTDAFKDITYVGLFLACIILTPAFLVFLFLPVAWFVMAPVHFWRSHINGAPFVVGDRVRILTGPYRDQISDVYEVWGHRNQLRVDLDSEARSKVGDVFSFTEVCRDISP